MTPIGNTRAAEGVDDTDRKTPGPQVVFDGLGNVGSVNPIEVWQ
jgi:hypothetical protein